jgi:hypothetical protein
VTAQIKEQHDMTSVNERLRVLLIALESVAEPMDDDDGGAVPVAAREPRAQP